MINKKIKIFLALLISLTFFSACSNNSPSTDNEEVTTPAQIIVENENTDLEIVDGSENTLTVSPTTAIPLQIVPQGEIVYDPENDIFPLTEKEIEVFENFSRTFDKNEFKDLEPLSVFKIWVVAGIHEAWETEYEMYTKSSVESFAKEEFFKYNLEDIESEYFTTRKMIAEVNFGNADEGEWVLDDDAEALGAKKSGHLVITPNNFDKSDLISDENTEEDSEVLIQTPNTDKPYNIKLIQIEDGIWELPYYPVY